MAVGQLERAEDSSHESYLESKRIMTEERRSRESRQGKQRVRSSDKALNIGQ